MERIQMKKDMTELLPAPKTVNDLDISNGGIAPDACKSREIGLLCHSPNLTIIERETVFRAGNETCCHEKAIAESTSLNGAFWT
jgi:hypothetical protein